MNRCLALLSLALFAPLIAFTGAAASRQSCFPDEAIPGWVADDLDLEAPGASRPLPRAEFELCSAAPGFAAGQDHYRYLIRRANGDFVFEASVVSIEAIGMAGVVARRDERGPQAARVRIAVHRTPSGYELRSGVRPDNGGVDREASAPVPVSLPLRLRIERSGDLLTTAWSMDGERFADHLVAEVSGTDLDHVLLVVGMVQASEDAGVQSAVLGEAGFVEPSGPLPDVQSCVDQLVIPATGGSELALRGHNLDAVTGVSLAGVPAQIVRQDIQSLVLRAAALPQREDASSAPPAPRNGDIVLQSAHGEHPLRTRVVYAGVPFVRGDVTGDERVDFRDLRRLRLALSNRRSVACLEAADVNADRSVDSRDWKDLRRYLLRNGRPPAEPFPEPGFAPDGGRACGLPAAPELFSVRSEPDAGAAAPARLVERQRPRHAGRGHGEAGKHPRARPGKRRPHPGLGGPRPQVREGDVLIVQGRGLPQDPARVAVRFGEVGTQVLPGSSATTLRLLVGPVPQGGAKCPLLLLDTAEATPPLGVASMRRRFGIAWAVDGPPPRHPRLCPEFLPSELAAVNVGRLASDGRSLFLPIDRRTWDPARPVEIDLSLPLPLVNGVSRGARAISFSYHDPAAASDYDAWLARLAVRMDDELAGGRNRGCGCDAQARPVAGGILISACEPVIGWTDPPTCCDPPAPGPGVKLKAPPPPLVGGTALTPIPSTCESDAGGDPRRLIWCEFEKLTRTHQYTDLPIWESFDPIGNILQGPAGMAQLEPPDERTTAEKSILFSQGFFDEALADGYLVPCQAAARAYYCPPGIKHQMPPFTESRRAVKTFWLTDGKLPPSLDPDDLYSYIDPNGERQNLVGMHLALASQESAEYWKWSTFFAPRMIGETTAKDGTPLKWDEDCTIGSISDRPVEIDGVWQSYYMCTTGAPGETGCGNPWVPGECQDLNCATCHQAIGKAHLPDSQPVGELWMAWLTQFAHDDIKACFDQIKAANEDEGVELYRDLAPAQCQ